MFAYTCRNTGKGVKEYIPNYYDCLLWEVRILNITNIWERLDFSLYTCVLLGSWQ